MATEAMAADGTDGAPITMRGIVVTPQGNFPEPEQEGAPNTGVDKSPFIAEMERRASAGQLSPSAMDAWNELKKRKGLETPAPTEEQAPQNEGLLRGPGIVATGFNKGMGSYVDGINEGLKGLGLPMSDEPFMGSAFIDKYLAGANLKPQNGMESVLARAGFEVGANVPLLAGALTARGASLAREEVLGPGGLASKGSVGRAGKEAAAVDGVQVGGMESTLQAIKNIPQAMVEQMVEVGPAKLAALETAVAAGAGAAADIVHQVFPEGGPTAEFVGEMIGSFAPSVALGIIQKARDLGGAGMGALRAVVGKETESDTRARLAGELSKAATPDEVKAGVQRADELRRQVSPDEHAKGDEGKGSGLELTAGEAVGGAVTDVQRSLERGKDVTFRKQALDRKKQNVQAVKDYFDATAPEGNPTRLIEHLEQQRAKNEGLLQIGLARTEAKLEAARGNLSKQREAFLGHLESRMQAADERVAQRLQAIGSRLSPKERGEIIRQEYDAELGSFRERSRADYHELDQLGHAELSVEGTMGKLAELEMGFPGAMQIIQKLNPRVGQVLNNIGHDYDVVLRSQKALADLGIRDASGPGTRIFTEANGQGSTRDVSGLSRGTPDWYLNLTVKPKGQQKVATEGSSIDRSSVESRLKKWAAGGKPDPNNEIDQEVLKAIKSDPEFSRTPYNEPVLAHLRDIPSASLKDLRQVRSDLLALSRQAKAQDNRMQRYLVNDLLTAVDGDIDQLLPGASAIADIYPEHGLLYRQVSADYRAGVETFLKGTANKLRLQNRYGDYTTYDDNVAALFFRNETTIQDFEKAFSSRPYAKAALRDYALESFMKAAVQKKGDHFVLDQLAYEDWMKEHAAHLKAFPDLEAAFKNTVTLLDEAAGLRKEAALYGASKRGEAALMRRLEQERQPGHVTGADISNAEAQLKHVQEIVDRTRHDWEHSLAERFIKERPDIAAQRLITSRDPIKEYDLLLQKAQRGGPDAVAGLNKSVWQALVDRMQPKLIGLNGDMNLGVFHKELQRFLTADKELVTRVLGPEGVQRIEASAEVIQRINRTGADKSDTAINLNLEKAIASTWLSRAFGVASGRIGHTFGIAERVGQRLIKYFEGMTQKQQEAILLESFFDPNVYQTLVLAGTHGPANELVRNRTRVHLNLLNLSEQTHEEDSK